MRSIPAIALLLAAVPASVHAELSEAERRMAAAIDERVPRALALLERSVDINSGTMSFDGVRSTGALFREELDALGFSTRWVDGAAWGRAGHVLAERDGRSGAPRALLIGHLDTVFEADSPFQRFERLDDSTAAGPGVIDMKGGIVVMLLALEALRGVGALDELGISVVLTGDEEKAGTPLELARKDLREAAERADIALGFEDGDGKFETAVVARRGATLWQLRSTGRPSHSSQVFHEDVGSGAIYEMARILTAFHDSLGGEKYLTFNPGVVLGGTTVEFDAPVGRGTAAGKQNVVAQDAASAGDLRAISADQRERAKEVMHRIVAAHFPQTGATIVFDDLYPPLAPSDGNRALLAAYDAASRDLGFGPVAAVDPARAGAADISFTAGLVDAALDGLGLMGTGGHTVDETADLGTLGPQAQRVAVTLLRIARRGLPSP